MEALKTHYITDSNQVRDIVPLLCTYPVLSIDTETRGLDPFQKYTLRSTQICTPDGNAYVFNTARVDIRPLRPVLENPDIIKLLHNAKFDYKMLRQQTGAKLNTIFDTMIAERMITVGLTMENSLVKVAKKYLNEDLNKTIRKQFIASTDIELTDAEIEYAARDTYILFKLYEILKAKLIELSIYAVAKMEFDILPVVGEMELAGLLIDGDKWLNIMAKNEPKRDQIRQELEEIALTVSSKETLFGTSISTINFSSTTQVLSILRKLGAKMRTINKEGETVYIEVPNSKEGTLQRIEHPFARILLKYREVDKQLAAFGSSFLGLINPITCRVHPSFNTYGAATGRFSSSEPNVQQIPRDSDFRSCFMARPGYKIITADFSNIEAKIAAELSGEDTLIQAFLNKTDLHKLAASKVFNVSVDKVTSEQRSIGKTLNFSSMYGAGPTKISFVLETTVERASQILDAYWKGYPKLRKWLSITGREAVDRGYAINLSGRKRFFRALPYGLDPKDLRKLRGSQERQGANFAIQSLNADMAKRALIGTYRALEGYDARIINTVHDEIGIEAREDIAEEVKDILVTQMVAAGELYIERMPVTVDAHVEDFWSK